MINIYIDTTNAKPCQKFEFSGSLSDLVSEAQTLIAALYLQLGDENPIAAEMFRLAISKSCATTGIVWRKADAMRESEES